MNFWGKNQYPSLRDKCYLDYKKYIFLGNQPEGLFCYKYFSNLTKIKTFVLIIFFLYKIRVILESNLKFHFLWSWGNIYLLKPNKPAVLLLVTFVIQSSHLLTNSSWYSLAFFWISPNSNIYQGYLVFRDHF